MPSPYLILTIQFVLGLVIFVAASRAYILPRLQRADVFAALAPVLLVQGIRMLGMTLLAPGQVGPEQDLEALKTIAYGDLAASTTATLAALAAFQHSALTRPLAWLFTVVGLTDFVVVGITVASASVLEYGLGVMWVTFGVIAPVLVLSHGYVLYALIARRREFAAPHPLATPHA